MWDQFAGPHVCLQCWHQQVGQSKQNYVCRRFLQLLCGFNINQTTTGVFCGQSKIRELPISSQPTTIPFSTQRSTTTSSLAETSSISIFAHQCTVNSETDAEPTARCESVPTDKSSLRLDWIQRRCPACSAGVRMCSTTGPGLDVFINNARWWSGLLQAG